MYKHKNLYTVIISHKITKKGNKQNLIYVHYYRKKETLLKLLLVKNQVVYLLVYYQLFKAAIQNNIVS